MQDKHTFIVNKMSSHALL